jgi:hypothetical protein
MHDFEASKASTPKSDLMGAQAERARPLRNGLDGEPDYVFWVTKEFWQLAEAAKIVCGRNPLNKYPSKSLFNVQFKVLDIIDIAYEAVKKGELASVRNSPIPNHVLVKPQDFLRWGNAQGFEIPLPLQGLGDSEESTSRFDDLIRERAIIVFKTLRIVFPRYTVEQIINHRAMHEIIGDEKVSHRKLRSWLSD